MMNTTDPDDHRDYAEEAYNEWLTRGGEEAPDGTEVYVDNEGES